MSDGWTTAASAGAAALVVATSATGLVRSVARRTGMVARPNPIVPQHTRPVAHLGGLGLGAGLAAGVGVLVIAGAPPGPGGMSAAGFAGAAALFLALGALDDVIELGAAAKFLLQALVAAVAVALGAFAPVTGLAPVDRAIALLWILTLVNAFNFTDVCDGLLATLSLVALAVLAAGQPAAASLALAGAGACAGFLLFNAPPATIFMGDAGSHLLGFLLAALTLGVARGSDAPAAAALGGLLLVGVPLFELVFLTAVRIRKGIPWWKGSPDHFALRLQAAGLTRLQTDAVAAAAGLACGAGATAMWRFGMAAAPLVMVIAALGALASAVLLLRWEVGAAPRRPAPGEAAAVAEPAVAARARAASADGVAP
jgi:UDP-GlcNAc:undecaprenyl-phosphate GlcNAc-1-phosphate transferase